MTSGSQAILEIQDLGVNYGVIAAVKQMNLHIQRGEIVALIGTNGSGKTSALRSISGLNKSIQGQIRFEGQEIMKLDPHKIVERGISQVPEGRGVFPDLTVLENLKLGAYVRNDKAGLPQIFRACSSYFRGWRSARSSSPGR